MGTGVHQVHRFGHFEVRPEQRQLLVQGRLSVLGARAFDLLLVLIEHRHRVVGKNELLDLVWPGLVVEEGNITVQVGTLRKLIGVDAIATIPGRGYRFTASLLDEAAANDDAPAEQPTRTAPPLRTNLPEVLPPLIGRDDDLAALDALLARHRLITITGAGGVGKTRLAERLLHDRRHQTAHGVAWVELAGITDPALVPGTMAGALGLQMRPGDPLKALVAALQPLQILVALDNAEHLLDAVGQVAQALLDEAPQVGLIVTSQTPLLLPTERVYQLGPLALPTQDTKPDEVLKFGAVALFVDRALAADRRFRTDPQAVAGIIGICKQLDGLPLAIELAAARVPMLGVTALSSALAERLHLLTQGRRGAPERQRTLRAALDWSTGLLGEVEATVFRRLGVFAGGFSLELARQVAADDGPIDEWAVVDALGALVDRSLAAADTSETPRYRLLESPRVVALEKLAQAGENAAVRQRHAQAVMCRFVEVEAACGAGQLGVDQALAALAPDIDNARAAIHWSLSIGDARSAVTLAPVLSFVLTRDRKAEVHLLWDLTAGYVDGDVPAAVAAKWALWHSRSFLSFDTSRAASWARVAVARYRQINDRQGLYLSLAALAMSTSRALELVDAATAVEEMQRIEDAAWPAQVRLFGAWAAVQIEVRSGNLAGGRQAMMRTRALAVAASDSTNAYAMLGAVADLDLAAGRIEDAVRAGHELEQQLRSGRNLFVLAICRVNLIGAFLWRGDIASARDRARLAWPLAAQFGLKAELADNLSLLAALEQRPNAVPCLKAYADATYAALGSAREVTEQRTAERAEQLAREQLGEAEFERLRREGSTLADSEVLALGLGEPGPG